MSVIRLAGLGGVRPEHRAATMQKALVVLESGGSSDRRRGPFGVPPFAAALNRLLAVHAADRFRAHRLSGMPSTA